MLFGGFDHKIDKKGRVFIPAAFREELGEKFLICRSIFRKNCLCVYSNEQWQKLVERINALPVPADKLINVKEFLYDGAFTVEFDTQGRILVPPMLREYAVLDTDVHIIGMDTNIEIWDAAIWAKKNSTNTFESVSDTLSGLTF